MINHRRPPPPRFIITSSSRWVTRRNGGESDAAAAETARARRRVLCTLATEEKEEEEEEREPTLYRRLSVLGGGGGGGEGESVTKTVNAYLREGGRCITKFQLDSCVKQLRKYNKFHHALQLMDWMEKRGTNLSYRDHAVRVDLLSKTKGIDATEHYFNCLPAPAKNRFTYGALLNSYCKNKMTDKALALFDTMTQLKFTSTLAYNNLMSLYMRLHDPHKVPHLAQKMKDNGLSPDTFTYNLLLNSHASLKDMEGVERVFKEMEIQDSCKCDWTTYCTLAVIYIEAGLIEKAEFALSEAEKKVNPRDRKSYHFLISLYASISNLSKVHYVWNSLKLVFPKTNNTSYLIILQALAKLDDLDGLKKCFKDWESTCSSYDMRLANVVVSALLGQDMAREAGLICEDALKRGSGPDCRTHELFMEFFIRNRQWDLAFSCMEASISKMKNKKWKVNQERMVAFLKHFEEEKDVAGAEEFCKMLKKCNNLDSEAYRLLLSTYVVANKKEPGMRKRLEKEKIEMTTEIEELLAKVCSTEKSGWDAQRGSEKK